MESSCPATTARQERRPFTSILLSRRVSITKISCGQSVHVMLLSSIS
jgi:hypothetical protein